MQLPLCELPRGAKGSSLQTSLTLGLPPVLGPSLAKPLASGGQLTCGALHLISFICLVVLLVRQGYSHPKAVMALVILAPAP